MSSVVLSYGASYLGKEELLWEKLLSTPYPHNQEFYRSLSATRNPEMITRLLEGEFRVISDDHVYSKDLPLLTPLQP